MRFGRHIRRCELALDFVLQIAQQLGHRNQNGDVLAADGIQNRAGVELQHEHGGAAQQRRNEDAERLPEQVAERQHVQNAHGLKRARPFLVLAHFLLDRA